MPLHRNPEARIRPLMLPFILLSLYMGLWYVFGDDQRFASPSFSAQLAIAPIEMWGVMFLSGAGFMMVSMLQRKLKWMQASLIIGGIIYQWWGLLFFFSAIQDSHGNPNGLAVYTFVALFHLLGAAPYLLNRLLYGKEQL